MGWVPVAFLYLLVAVAATSILLAPAQVVWRAFRVRPLLRKYRRLRGSRPNLPKSIQESPRYKWTLQQEELLHHARNRAFVSLAVLFLVTEGFMFLQGYRWPGLPGDLEGIDKLLASLAEHVVRTVGLIGPLRTSLGVAIAVAGAFLAVVWLDLVGDLLGRPLLFARDRATAARERLAAERAETKRLLEEAASPPLEVVPNFYAELEIPTSAPIGRVMGMLDSLELRWRRKELVGDEATRDIARQYLDLVARARTVLLDSDRRADYDRKIGLRGGPDSR